MRIARTATALPIALSAALGCARGDAALERMTPAEREIVDRVLTRIELETTEADLVRELGPPHRGAGTSRPVWLGPDGSQRSQIAVYFDERGRVFRVRWMKLGSFLWEREVGRTAEGNGS